MLNQRTLDILKEAAIKYQKNLFNNSFLIITKDGTKYNSIECKFPASCFKHLTGAKWNSKVIGKENRLEGSKAFDFYKSLISDKMSMNTHWEFDSRAEQKLHVLPQAVEFYKHARYCGKFNNQSNVLVCDYVVGNRRFAICFDKEKSNNGLYFPRSLLEIDASKLASVSEAEIAIFRKPIKDNNYLECVYISDSVKEPLFKLPLPKEIKNKISNYLKIEEGQYELANYQASHSKKSSDDGKSK